MAKFIQRFNTISNQLNSKIQERKLRGNGVNFSQRLQIAISYWHEVIIPVEEQTVVYDQTSQWLQFNGIKDLAGYIYEEWNPDTNNLIMEGLKRMRITNKFFEPVETVFNKLNIPHGSNEIIVSIALIITSVAYSIYNLSKNDAPINKPSKDEGLLPPTIKPLTIIKSSLILVISAAQKDLANSIQRKTEVNYEDAEKLYQGTQYLSKRLESLEDIKQKIKGIQLSEESEYDVYLVMIELKRDDQRFDKGVNQLDRYDAFRELPDLAARVEVSDRLPMESYENLGVYIR